MDDKQKYYLSLSLFFVGAAVLFLALFWIDYIPFKQKLLVLSVVIMASMALLIITKTGIWRALSGILLIVVSLYFINTQNDLATITQSTQYEVVEYDLLSLDRQEYNTNKVGVFGVRPEHHEELSDNFPEKTEFVNYEDLDLLAQDLENKIIYSFLINSGLKPTLSVSQSLQKYEFNQEATYSIKVDNKTQAKKVDLLNESFLIYISGIDVEGNVLTRSENDMNFILAANPKTNTILTVSVPKDSYLRLACGEQKMDAIKNAGYYGIECSMQTLESYFNLEFNYYLRLNLAGLEPLVNALDSVSVYSDNEYTGSGGTNIKKGYNTLNGSEALETIRKKENELDVINEENSQHRYLIEAIMNKMLNENNIYSLPQHLSLLKNVLDTNLNDRDLSKIISDQISNKHTWTINSMNLRGYADHQVLYTDQSGESHFIYWPGEGSKRDILEAIDKVMEND